MRFLEDFSSAAALDEIASPACADKKRLSQNEGAAGRKGMRSLSLSLSLLDWEFFSIGAVSIFAE